MRRSPAALSTALSAALSLALSACAAARPTTVDIAQVRAEPDPEPSEAAPEVKPSATPACTWVAPALRASGDAVSLCFAADGACFAELPSPFHGPVTVRLPAGDPRATGALLDVYTEGAQLSAWTPADEILLEPKTPVVFGGVAIPRSGHRWLVDRARAGGLELTMSPTVGLLWKRTPPRARVACDDVGPEPADGWEALIRPAIGRPGDADLGEHVLSIGQIIGVATRPEGPDVIEVTVDEEDDTVIELLEQRGPRSFILWWQSDMVYFGWVDTAVLGGPAPPVHGSLPAGPVPSIPWPMPPQLPMRCPADVPLSASVAGSRAEIGTLEKGAAFDVVTRTAPFAQIRLRGRSLTLLDNSEWQIPSTALDSCDKSP